MLSNEIDPFVRFAAKRRGVSEMKRVAYASDYRFLYFLKGCCQLEIESERHIPQKGDVFIIPPMSRYSLTGSPDTEFYIINFDYTHSFSYIVNAMPICNEKSQSNITEHIDFSDLPQLSQPFKTQTFSVEGYLSKAAELYKSKPLYFRLEMNACFSFVLSHIFKKLLNQNNGKGISDIISYIADHYDEKITNQTIGIHFNYHPNYINKLFVDYTGKSLHRYIMDYRIETAIMLLNTTEMTITEIAEKTGWSSISHFSKYFKMTTGISPSQYMGSFQC